MSKSHCDDEDDETPVARPLRVWALFAFLLALVLIAQLPSTPVDPYRPVQPFPLALPEAGCGEG